jgi:hypothetical protein
VETTVTIDAAQLEGLATRLSALEGVLDEADKVALLAIFALAGEALDARIDAKLEVAGFAQQGFGLGIQVGVPASLPGLGQGLLGEVGQQGVTARKAGKPQQEFLKVTMQEVFISG